MQWQDCEDVYIVAADLCRVTLDKLQAPRWQWRSHICHDSVCGNGNLLFRRNPAFYIFRIFPQVWIKIFKFPHNGKFLLIRDYVQ